MGYRGEIRVNDEFLGEAKVFVYLNNELIDRYLHKFEKRGARNKKGEEYIISGGEVEDTSITLYLSKKETEGLINTLSEMLSEIIDISMKPSETPVFRIRAMGYSRDSKPYIKQVIYALKEAMKSKSKIKFHLYNG